MRLPWSLSPSLIVIPLAVLAAFHSVMPSQWSLLVSQSVHCLFPFRKHSSNATPSKAPDLDALIDKQRDRALRGVLDNIGPNGRLVKGAGHGVVIASPSKTDPNYFYTWARDAALVIKVLVDELAEGSQELQATIDDYVGAQARLQTVTSLSGSLYTGAGLGEPKFEADQSKFTGSWGRPQRDGPPLRAIALMSYADWLLENGDEGKAKEVVWPIIANDLNYVGEYWNQTGFDLWEEVQGSSFFTLQAQYRALAQGAALSKKLDVSCPGCVSQAPEILCFLRSFWNGSTLVANVNTDADRSGVDISTLLGALVAFDLEAPWDAELLQPSSPKVLASLKVLVRACKKIYRLNRKANSTDGVHLGRYPEDVYRGGNPWYLATFAAAEVLYLAVAQWRTHGFVAIEDTSRPFFAALLPAMKRGIYHADDDGDTFHNITSAITKYADSFLLKAFEHIPRSGDLSEQYSRRDGSPLSAKNLTWSYAAFLSATSRRSGAMPRPWASQEGARVPAACAPTSAKGVYRAAVAAGAPARGSLCTVPVEFRVRATTYWGESVLVFGSSDELGAWRARAAWPLGAEEYAEGRPVWRVRVELPAAEKLAYRYLRRGSDGKMTRERKERVLRVQACGSGAQVVEDAWQV